MCDLQTRRSRSFQILHLHQHLTSFTRHCAKSDHTESTHYGGALQLYSISRHCAQCVDSLCSYLGDSDTHNAELVGNQSQSACQTPHSACVRRPIRFPTATDCRLYHRAVCCLRRYTGRSHTPTACMQNGFEQLNTWLSRLHSLLIRQVALVIAITS